MPRRQETMDELKVEPQKALLRFEEVDVPKQLTPKERLQKNQQIQGR